MNLSVNKMQRREGWPLRLLLISIISGLAVLASCSKDQKRSSGSEAEHDHEHEGETTGETTGGEASAGSGSGDGGAVYEDTLEQCQEKGLAWIAVADVGGTKKGVCGAPLLDWCCQYPDILARFSSHDELKTNIDKFLDGSWEKGTPSDKKLRLYHCSQSNGKYEFHFALISGSARYYGTANWSGPASNVGKTRSECPAPTTASLKVDGGATTGGSTGGGGTTDGSGTADGAGTGDGTADGGTGDGTADGGTDGEGGADGTDA